MTVPPPSAHLAAHLPQHFQERHVAGSESRVRQASVTRPPVAAAAAAKVIAGVAGVRLGLEIRVPALAGIAEILGATALWEDSALCDSVTRSRSSSRKKGQLQMSGVSVAFVNHGSHA